MLKHSRGTEGASSEPEALSRSIARGDAFDQRSRAQAESREAGTPDQTQPAKAESTCEANCDRFSITGA
jgi:hypothetical protein